MDNSEEISKIAKSIKESIVKASNIAHTLGNIEKEIETLSFLQSQIEENLKYLKKKKVVTLAVEFKKTKVDLSTIKQKLTDAKQNKETIKKALKENETNIKKLKEAYAKISKSTSNVITGKFRK